MPREFAPWGLPVVAALALGALSPERAGAAPGPFVIEAETLAPRARATQGRVSAQDMRGFGPSWSGGAQLLWVPPTAGHQLNLLLVAPSAGTVDLTLVYTRAANHGDFVVYVGGVQRGEVQRGYAPRPAPSGRAALGRVALAAGPNQVVITGTGQDPRSIGFVVGLDRFEATPPPPPSGSPPAVSPPGVSRPGARVPRVPATAPAPVRVPPTDLQGLLRPWSRSLESWRAGARAASPTLEVEVRPASGQEFPAHYGVDLLVDAESGESLERTFRMAHSLPGATSVVWQVCAFEPPPKAVGWREPPGLVAEGEVQSVPKPNAKGTFTIDFSAFYTPPARREPGGAPRAGTRVATDARGPVEVFQGPRRVDRRVPGASRPDTIVLAPAATLEAWFGSLERVYWVRVGCRSAAGGLLAFPSNAVRVRFGPVPPPDIDLTDMHKPTPPPAWVERERLRVRLLEYAPIRWQAADAHKRWVVSGPHPWRNLPGGFGGSNWSEWPFGPKGTKIYLSGEDDDPDLIESITEAFEDMVSFFVDAINWVSKAYETIKAEALSVVARMIPGCKAECRDALKFGLQIGLGALGLPPEIPDFDALVAMGKGHLVDVLVQEALAQGLPGLGEPLAREAAERLLDEVERRARDTADRGTSGLAWLRPDPDALYRPAFVRVEIVNPGTQVQRPHLTVTVSGGEPWGWVFQQVNLNLPPIPPGGRSEVPVFLKTDPWWWEARDARMHRGTSSSSRAADAWRAAYSGPCRVSVQVESFLTPPQGTGTQIAHSATGVDQRGDQPYRAP